MASDRHSVNVPMPASYVAAPGSIPRTHIRIDVYYSKGGTNLFSGRGEPRGYWLSATPIEVHDGGGFGMLIGDKMGSRIFLTPATRLNAKALAVLADRVLPLAPSIAEAIAIGDKANAAALARSAAAYTGMTAAVAS